MPSSSLGHHQDWSLAATWLAQDSFQRRARRRRRHPTSLKKALPEEREQECSLGETQNIQKLMNVFNQPEGYISWSVCLEKRSTIHMNPRPCVWLNLSQLKRNSIHAPRRQSRVCREDGFGHLKLTPRSRLQCDQFIQSITFKTLICKN